MQASEHELVDGLLPWFVNRTLAQDEHERVQRHVDGCESCRDTVALLAVVQSTVRHDTATPMVRAPRTEKLLGTIEGLQKRNRRRRLLTTTLMAASVAAVLLAGLLLPTYRDSTDSKPTLYETTTTSAAPPVSMDYVLDVRFAPGIPLAEQERVLRGLEARDINQDGPQDELNATHRVTVNLSAGSLEELEQYLDEVRSLPQVTSADVVALQLPMKPPE